MASKQQSNIPNKNDIIISPTTSRPIKVGGRSWLKLVKEGLVSGHYIDPKKLGKISDNPDEQIEEINKTLPRGKQAVRGRGRYKGQITTRNKTPDIQDVSRHTAKMAGKIVNDNIENFAELEGDDIETEIERLILQELAIAKGPQTKKKTRNKIKAEEEKYTLQEANFSDVSETFNDEEEEEDFFGDEEDIDYFQDE